VNGLLKKCDAAAQVAAAAPGKFYPDGTRGGIWRLGVLAVNGSGPQRGRRLWTGRRRQRGSICGDRGGNVRFHFQNIGEFASERIAPHMRRVADLDQLDVNAHLVAGALHAAFQHILHVERAADIRMAGWPQFWMRWLQLLPGGADRAGRVSCG